MSRLDELMWEEPQQVLARSGWVNDPRAIYRNELRGELTPYIGELQEQLNDADNLEFDLASWNAELAELLEERDSYKAQAEYERQARIDAADFPRNRHDYVPCDRCSLDCGMDAVIPDDVWKQIAPESDYPEAGMLCLWCMDELLAERGVQAPVEVRLYYPGKVLLSAPYSDGVVGELREHCTQMERQWVESSALIEKLIEERDALLAAIEAMDTQIGRPTIENYWHVGPESQVIQDFWATFDRVKGGAG